MKLFRALRIIILFIFQSLTIRAKDISLVEFQGLLYTEVNSEIDEQQSFSSERNDYSRKSDDDKRLPVSYTHLTLPTICSV